jgi:ferredoxin-NADP reductase
MKPREFTCVVRSKRMLTPTVFEISFDTHEPVEFQAGQFISIIIPGAGPKGRDLRRAYSIASAPEVRPIELCVKLVEEGPGTNYLFKLNVGDTFKGWAPYGDFVYEPKAGRQACFIATGTGVAPFRSMVLSSKYKSEPPARAWCLLGVRTEDELLYTTDVGQLSSLSWVTTVSQPKGHYEGFRGRVTDFIRSLGDDFNWAQTDFYLCGNGEMIKEAKEILGARGVDKDAIHQEKYY